MIDEAALRRGACSAPAQFGNKATILGGDYLIGKSMSICASLKDQEVMQLFSGIVTSLVEGELLQAEASLVQTEFSQTNATGLNWDVYLRKTELKAASMISTVLECAVILGGASESDPWRKIAYNYGLEFGMAFQVIVYIAFSEEYTNWECKANR